MGSSPGFSLGVALVLNLVWHTPISYAATCSGTVITGAVFRDYNASGARDGEEPGIAGIIVTAYSANGLITACETTADGMYGISPAGLFPIRLEFTLPADGHLNALQPGVVGSDSATTVTFVNGPGAEINVGFNNPAQYCGANPAPDLAISCYVFGEQNDNPDGVNKNLDVLKSFPYSAGSADLTDDAAVRSPISSHRALAKEVGSTWGLAWDAKNQTLYAAAFLKRHAGFGPNGPGALYQISPITTQLFYNFGAGADPHPQPGDTCLSPGHSNQKTNGNCWFNDASAFDQVGKIGFGDLDISEDFNTLYTVNLAMNNLLSIPIANPAAFVATPVPIPPTCPSASDVRPFGLGVNDGTLYVGIICSAESTQNINHLRAYVYAFSKGTFATTPTLDFSLNYDRGIGTLEWAYWLNHTTFNANDSRQKNGKWAQPWLTDITFDHGDMILALRDRNADQFGTAAGGPDPSDPNSYSAIARGDILRACADPTAGNGQWILEANGKCGNRITNGAGQGEGPSGGEYYFQDKQTSPLHNETSLGSQLQIPGLPDVVSTVFNPIENHNAVSDAGIKWYNNRQGTTTRGYLLYDASGNPAFFQKANGLGDLTALCPAASLEIGNRVWRDTNNNGIQDPMEPGIDGVTVELYRKGVLVGISSTANSGQYYFNDSNVNQHGATGIAAGTGVSGSNSEYEVRIPQAVGAGQQANLTGLNLTVVDNDRSINGDLRDSDGVLNGFAASYLIPYAQLVNAGNNNHTYDFGFFLSPISMPTSTSTATLSATPTLTPAIPLTATPTFTPTVPLTSMPTATVILTATPTATVVFAPTPEPPTLSLGNLVWDDLNNNGFVDSHEDGIAGITVHLYRDDNRYAGANGAALATTITNEAGYYLFTKLSTGAYRVEVVPLPGYRSSTGNGMLSNLSGSYESAPAPDDNPTDNDDNGTTSDNLVRSGRVTLTVGGAPTGELPTLGLVDDTPDANANYTIDFGFFRLPTALLDSKIPTLTRLIYLPLIRN